MRSIRPAAVMVVAVLAACAAPAAGRPNDPVTWDEIVAQSPPASVEPVPYGPEPQQFGELRLPPGEGPHPVVVLLHGGCWMAEYDLAHVRPVAEALRAEGYAAWTLEYRRVGNPGGGWPGTFQDVSRGMDHLRTLRESHPLDLDRVVILGHSAGGHLALWLAARGGLGSESWTDSVDPLLPRGVVALAAISDLAAYSTGDRDCNEAVPLLLGGGPSEQPDRYRLASPIERLPIEIPQRMVHGERDEIVPAAQSRSYAAAARAEGSDVVYLAAPRAGHFDLIAPFAPAWLQVLRAVHEMSGSR